MYEHKQRDKDNIVIFNLVIANRLIREGFRVVKIGLNQKDPTKVVVIFQKSREIIESLAKNHNIHLKQRD